MSSSADLYERACRVMPGGVNSPVRAFRAVGGTPPFVASATGPFVRTVDGRELIDLVSSWGALLFGHADPAIVSAVGEAASRGTSFGMPTAGEVELAELIRDLVPSIELVRLVSSGTEATAAAVRVARGATGRPGVVTFEGCYHGHADAFLVRAGSGAATQGEPDSAGVPAGAVADTRPVRYNDLSSVETALRSGDVAAVLVEPVAGNMGVVPPDDGFLEGLRSLCDDHGSLLVFDEVMTGFRLAPGGAQELYRVRPDLTCLGKVVAGGAPAAAYGGREDLMRLVAPDGPVYQAGTLAGNPLAVAAGLTCLRRIRDEVGVHARLEALGGRLAARLAAAVGGRGCVQRVGSMLTVFLGMERVRSWDDAARVDRDAFARFFAAALDAGVLLPPSPFEALFLTLAHEEVEDELGERLEAAAGAAVAG